MVPIAIGLNINWVAIGDRFNFHAREEASTGNPVTGNEVSMDGK